jgi:hypothetical protein
MSDFTFDFNMFIRESKDILVNPKSYFSTIKTTGGLLEPLVKALIYGVIAGFFVLLWSLFNIGITSGGFPGGEIGILTFVKYIIATVIGLFVGTVILLIISAICKGSTDFETSIRITAAVMVIMPISTFLGFLVGLNFYVGIILRLAIIVYSLWLLYNSLIETLKAKPETTKIVIYVLVALFIILMLPGLVMQRKADKLMNNSEIKELFKDIEKK